MGGQLLGGTTPPPPPTPPPPHPPTHPPTHHPPPPHPPTPNVGVGVCVWCLGRGTRPKDFRICVVHWSYMSHFKGWVNLHQFVGGGVGVGGVGWDVGVCVSHFQCIYHMVFKVTLVYYVIVPIKTVTESCNIDLKFSMWTLSLPVKKSLKWVGS